jgi:nucleoside-diphosphate-sugar epimerase
MRVLVAGVPGAIGKQLVPRLAAAGHEVHGMTHSESKQAMLEALGAVPVVAGALDPDQAAEAAGRARPEVSCGADQVPSGSRRRASGAGAAATPAL